MTLDARSVHLLSLTVVVFLVPGSTAQGQDLDFVRPEQVEALQAAPESTEGTAAAPTEDNPEATVAETTGPITVASPIADHLVQRKLERLLPRYPGVRSIEVEVDEGVVTLTGHVEDSEVRDRLRDFVRRVEGVNLVLNRTRTDAQVLTARELLIKRFNTYWHLVQRSWLLFVVAVVIVILTILLTRLFGRYSDLLLSPFIESVLLRSVVGSILGMGIFFLGLFSALTILGLTQAVLSVVGLAGVVALALSFAFRDIAENFISSVLLGVRRPFRVGDFVEVADQAGVVRALNTRATILMTLEGHQVRIPNATVFKNTMVVRTAADKIRQSFDVLIGYDHSTTTAQEAIARSLRAHDGVLNDPPPRVLVEDLEPGGVRLRAYYWRPARGIDSLKLRSDVMLRSKVALVEAGITPPPTSVVLSVNDQVEVALAPPEGDGAGRPAPALKRTGSGLSTEKARANLENDARVAASASAHSEDAQNDAMERVLALAEMDASAEGENLLEDAPPAKPRSDSKGQSGR